MKSVGSVSLWIQELKAGNTDSATMIWLRYFDRLARWARRRADGCCRDEDVEEITMDALDRVFRLAINGQLDGVRNRDQLWAILTRVTRDKVVDRIRYLSRQCRDRRQTVTLDADLVSETNQVNGFHMATGLPADRLPTLVDTVHRLLAQLDGPQRELVQWRLNGDTVEEIAIRINRSQATVARRLRALRTLWEKSLMSDNHSNGSRDGNTGENRVPRMASRHAGSVPHAACGSHGTVCETREPFTSR